MTYLIIGSKGQLGTELGKLLPQALAADCTELDITDAAAVKNYVNAHAVDVIINCAAYTAVDKAEDEPEKAAAVNAAGVANLAASGAAVIHISTDYVFDGDGHRPYTPQDTPHPVSVYGRTKLAGEQALMETAETAVIIRTAWLYSPHGNNFVKTMLRLGSERKDINVVCDQIGSPTSAADLAAAICAILPRLKKGMKGIYHYTNEGVCSWYDFAVEIMALGKRNCKVHPILSSQYPTKATRPFYSVLDKTAIRNDFGITIPHWKESLSTCMQELGEPESNNPQHTFSMMDSKSKERRYVRFLACLIPSRKARRQFRARHLNVDSGPPPRFIAKAHNTLIRLLAIFVLSRAKRREFRKTHLIKHVAITSPRYRGCSGLLFRKSKISGYNECLHSSLFDEKYYRETHMQDCMQNMDAVLHYMLVGWRLGYNPSPYFSTKKYLIRRPDVDRAGINPLVHYDTRGRMEMPEESFPVANTYSFHEPVGFDRQAFMKDRNKILLVSHMLNYTGAPMLLMNVAEVLCASGCNATILCSQDGVLRAELLNRGIPVIIDDGAFCEHDGYKRYVEEGYAFCLVNTMLSYGALCVFKDHILCAWWIHENIKDDSKINHTLRELFATFKNIYVPSELTKSYLEPYCGDLRILTYPVKDSVGDAFALKKETDVLRCAVVASYNDRKAQDVLIKALALLPKAQHTHIHVRLFGEETSSGYTLYLQKLSKDLPNVVFEQVIRDRAKYHAIYEEIDVLICPSREDPYPLVVIDALMHGCPVVISDHVGQKHLIENGKNGYVFESGNPQDLAEKLGQMIDNKNSLPAMSLAARELYLKSFDYAACSKAFLHMVEETCKSK